uniref:UDP-N-acetylglucosamine transferase subunit ALG14 n=1 Tax=Eptatretus burgeri TaxID=7764 RepID=A0A8C4NE33_EPTBU
MSLCVTLLLGIPVVLCLLYVLASVRGHRRREWRSRTEHAVSVLVIAGSGGHTAEILWLIQNLPAYYKVHDFLLAETDTTSEAPIQKLIGPTFGFNNCHNKTNMIISSKCFVTLFIVMGQVRYALQVRIHRVPRAREVGQSWFTSIFSTFRALTSSVSFAFHLHPQLVLCNGPGVCVAPCLAFVFAAFFRQIAVQLGLAQRVGSSDSTNVVFVESVCRVRSLSLSAWLLRPFLDALIVQWPPLVVQFPSTCYLGRLV